MSYTAFRKMPASMVHLAGIRTGAWSRRAILRAHGWWHPAADALVGREMGWGRRRGYVRVAPAGTVPAAHRERLDTLAANLLLLAALADRVAVIPETACSFKPRGRSCYDGCLHDSLETAPRQLVNRSVGRGGQQVAGRLQQRCAWLPPKRCWRVECVLRPNNDPPRPND